MQVLVAQTSVCVFFGPCENQNHTGFSLYYLTALHFAVSAWNGTGKGPQLNSCEKFALVLQVSCTNVVRSTS